MVKNRIGGNAIADIIIYGRQAVRNQQNLPLLKKITSIKKSEIVVK